MPEPQHVAIQAPVITGDIVELAAPGSRVFRKEVLRVGTINYKGRRLDFTPDYLDGLVNAHNAHAFDSVPLVFTDAQNRHTQDIERIRGEAIGLERDGDRLFALVRASNDKAAALLRENPNIGVSVRIEQPLERADGKRFPAAIQHVLATANPRVTGMAPWEPVDLAVGDLPVIDLSTYDFADGEDNAPKEPDMADAPAAPFTPEQEAAIKAMLANLTNTTEPAKPALNEYQPPSDEEMARIAAAILAEDDTDVTAETTAGELVTAGASLSVEDSSEAVELAARLDAQAVELANMRSERDAERYARLVDTLANDHGIPPAITELAKPLLHGSHAVELANGAEVEAGDIVRKVMVALADHTRILDLSRPVAYDSGKADEDKVVAERAAKDADAYAREFGLV